VSQFLRIIQGFLLIALSASLVGWVLPGSYKNYSKADLLTEKLDYVILSINGERRVYPSGQEIHLLRGDKVKVVSAILKNHSVKPKVVNVVGYSSFESKGSDDRGVDIDTSKQFRRVWSLEKKGHKFAVTVSSDKVLHGFVILVLDLPQLKFVDLMINQKLKVMRKDEVLVLSADDRIKIKNVRTNIKNGPKAHYQIIKTNNLELKNASLRPAESFEIQFSRAGIIFAKVPMLIENL
jgi:hypothetical protein